MELWGKGYTVLKVLFMNKVRRVSSESHFYISGIINSVNCCFGVGENKKRKPPASVLNTDDSSMNPE